MTWRNWAGNQRTDPALVVGARDAGDVVDTVQGAAAEGLRVKALGSGHSFTPIAVADGVARGRRRTRRSCTSTAGG